MRQPEANGRYVFYYYCQPEHVPLGEFGRNWCGVRHRSPEAADKHCRRGEIVRVAYGDGGCGELPFGGKPQAKGC